MKFINTIKLSTVNHGYVVAYQVSFKVRHRSVSPTHDARSVSYHLGVLDQVSEGEAASPKAFKGSVSQPPAPPGDAASSSHPSRQCLPHPR